MASSKNVISILLLDVYSTSQPLEPELVESSEKLEAHSSYLSEITLDQETHDFLIIPTQEIERFSIETWLQVH